MKCISKKHLKTVYSHQRLKKAKFQERPVFSHQNGKCLKKKKKLMGMARIQEYGHFMNMAFDLTEHTVEQRKTENT